MPNTNKNFIEFMKDFSERESFDNDEFVSTILPLFMQVKSSHVDDHRVAPLEGVDDIYETEIGTLSFPKSKTHAFSINTKVLKQVEQGTRVLPVDLDEGNTVREITEEDKELKELRIEKNRNAGITKPVYLSGYLSYEHCIDHHDELTDIFSLGMVMASLAFGLDFNNLDDLKQFVSNRQDLFVLNLDLHPALVHLIFDLTDLSRKKRPAELALIIERLKKYKEETSTLDKQANQPKSILERNKLNREEVEANRQKLLFSLREKVLDKSEHNIFYSFKESTEIYDLTKMSLLSSNFEGTNLEDSLIQWRNSFAKGFIRGKDLNLTNYFEKLSEEDIEAITEITNSATDIKREAGITSMYMVLAKLHFYDQEIGRFRTAPLVFLPVEMVEKKSANGKKEVLQTASYEAFLNPLLVHYFKERFGIELIKKINLEDLSIEGLYRSLKSTIFSVDKGIELELKESYSSKSSETAQDQVVESVNDMNPGRWIFDISRLYIGVFDLYSQFALYDYNYLLNNKIVSECFDELFINQPPAPSFDNEGELFPPPQKRRGLGGGQEYNIFPSNPIQDRIASQVAQGKQMIIDSPNGTNREQMIVNLITNSLGKDKKVLYLSASQRNISSIANILNKHDLGDLVCTVSDPNIERKEFLKNLQETYEDFLRPRDQLEGQVEVRKDLIKKIESIKKELREQYEKMGLESEESGHTVHQLIERLIELKHSDIELKSEQKPIVPSYENWGKYGDAIKNLSQKMRLLGEKPRFGDSSIAFLKEDLFKEENRRFDFMRQILKLQPLFARVVNVLDEIKISQKFLEKFDDLAGLVNRAQDVKVLAENEILFLINPKDSNAIDYNRLINKYRRKKVELEEAYEMNSGWKVKLSEGEVRHALDHLSSYDNIPFKLLNPSYRAFKKSLENKYDFNRHADKPTPFQVLSSLENEFKVRRLLKELYREISAKYGIGDIEKTDELITKLRVDDTEGLLCPEDEYLLNHPRNKEIILGLSVIFKEIRQLDHILNDLFSDHDDVSLAGLIEICKDLSRVSEKMPELMPVIRNFMELPEEIKTFLTRIPVDEYEAECIMARRSLQDLIAPDDQEDGLKDKGQDSTNQDLVNIDKSQKVDVAERLERLIHLENDLLEVNAELVKWRIKRKFLEKVNLASKSYSQLNQTQKTFKKYYNTGRQILELEFNRSIRCKSVGDLVSREPALILNDIKPLWLMHYKAAIESIPIDTMDFDILIIDNGEEIELQHIAPMVYRAGQTIIFSKKDFVQEYNREYLKPGLRHIPTESLKIQSGEGNKKLFRFFNSAFYFNSLISIPELSTKENNSYKEIRKIYDARKVYEEVERGELSFHHLSEGIYEEKKNVLEAQYIALLLREIVLEKKLKSTLGVVSVTEEQRDEIMNQLYIMAEKDEVLRKRLAAVMLPKKNQFEKLFITDLKSVQGQKADTIIFSATCGRDKSYKISSDFDIMGGKHGKHFLEKLLSMSNKNMLVVSSIKADDISNEYSEALILYKKFLRYAEYVAKNDYEHVESLMIDMDIENERQIDSFNNVKYIQKQIGKEIERLGFTVEYNIGHKDFVLDIGIRSMIETSQGGVESGKQSNNRTIEHNDTYELGILIDSFDYDKSDVLGCDFYRYRRFKQEGWDVIQVMIKDWSMQADRVLDQIKVRLGIEIEEKLAPIRVVSRQKVEEKVVNTKVVEDEKTVDIEEKSENRIPKEAKDAAKQALDSSKKDGNSIFKQIDNINDYQSKIRQPEIKVVKVDFGVKEAT